MDKHTKQQNIDKLLNKKHSKTGLMFSNFAKKISDWVGNAYAFAIACFLILLWLASGPIFHYSDTWQLIINTTTTIVTFLIVFLIQHTQNRDTEIMNLKLDELIKGHKGARNSVIDLTELSDSELKKLEESYKKLCAQRKQDK